MSKSRDRSDESPRDEVLEQQKESARTVELEWICGRVVDTHGDVLNVHTGVCQRVIPYILHHAHTQQ